ncbi:MAG: restriction endonuclease [Theionarchaea archaeon]|nr:restriction endonuclease [Theionarchaea archaeon]MBU7037436.1 restriction endonuclease [Theionarchaea archaeon]
MTTYVTKADGTRVPFDRGKIVKTCLRMGASQTLAETVASEVESRTNDGVRTRRIMEMIFALMAEYKPATKHVISLRKALALMNSKPDFEHFVRTLLNRKGYTVSPNQILAGKCVEHEVDGIIEKDGKTFLLEVKHHRNYRTVTGLDEARIARAVLEDVADGSESGHNDLKINGILLVCNTKFSDYARRYADCRGIDYLGWNAPPELDLAASIGETQVYPATYLKGLDSLTLKALSSAGIVLLKQVVDMDFDELKRKTGISKKKLSSLVKKAEIVLSEEKG